jgi:hypothetical protein
VQCHKPGADKPGNVRLLAADRRLYVDPDPAREAGRRARVLDSVDAGVGGTMPKNLPALPPAQVATIREWAARR